MRSAFALLLVLCTVHVVSVQDDIPDNPLFPKPRPKRIFIGPMVGYNSNFHGGAFNTLGGSVGSSADCGSFTTGSGNGILAGLAGEYWFKPGGPTALQVRVYYEQKPGSFTTTGAAYPFLVQTKTAQGADTAYTVSLSRDYYVQAKYNLINVEVEYKYNFPGTRFGVAAGPKVGILAGSEYYQYQQLSSGFVFTESGTNRLDLVPKGPISGVSGIRLALVAHIQYELLAGPFLVTPRVLYDLGVTNVTDGWHVSSLAGTIEIKYGF